MSFERLPQTPPSAPAPPAPPSAPGVTFSTGDLQAAPMTRADVEALRGRRDELRGQLDAAVNRRNETARQLLKSDGGVAKTGLEQRLSVLDQRIVQLEKDIAANGQQLSSLPGALMASSEVARDNNNFRTGPFSSGQLTAITILSIVFVWGPLAWAAERRMLRRPVVSKPTPQMLENAERLERMEQAVDSIAIEVERISEGQRFVTQLMSKRAEPAALSEGSAPAEPIRVAQGVATPVR